MKKRLYTLDLLRFILAILVVILHFFEIYGYPVFENSQNYIHFVGVPFYHVTLSRAVDVFFVLSGFTMVYSTQKQQSSIEFLKKRAARIFPLYILATLLAAPFFLMIPSSSPQHRIFTLEYIVNSFILRTDQQPFLISVAWTLAFEWVFYVVFATVMSFSHKYRVQIVSILFSILMIASTFITYTGYGYLSVLLDTRFLLIQFIAGMWIAFFIEKLVLKKGWIYLTIGSLLIYMSIYTPLFDLHYRGLVFVIPASLVVIGAINTNIKEKYSNMIRKCGDISYTIYIVHTFTAFAFAYLLYNVLQIRTNPYLWMILSVGITIGVSWFVHHYIEKPLYNYFTNFQLRKKRG